MAEVPPGWTPAPSSFPLPIGAALQILTVSTETLTKLSYQD
jgi:hypothetical protein